MAFGHLGKWGQGLIRDYRFTWTLRFWYKKFVKQIKYRYISGDPDPALPQQKSIIKDAYPVELLSSASKLFARRQIYKSTDRGLVGFIPLIGKSAGSNHAKENCRRAKVEKAD